MASGLGRRAAIVGAVALVAATIAAAQEPAAPAAAPGLLEGPPFDRITLVDGTTLTVEPISPRPLPPFDAEKARRNRERAKAQRPPAEGNVGLPGQPRGMDLPPKPGDEEAAEDERTSKVALHTIGPEPQDFVVDRVNVRKVDYFEDLLLAEGDRLRGQRKYDRAFEHYLAVKRRDPAWAGLDERVNRLLYEEGSTALADGDGERGLRLLRELNARRADYPGLADRLGGAYGDRIDRAFARGAYALGRKVLRELQGLTPDHPVVAQARARFVAAAKAEADRAAAPGATPADRAEAMAEALRIWPGLEGGASKYEAAFVASPVLDVGVIDLARGEGPWETIPGEARVSRLVYRPALADATEEARRGDRPGQLAAGVEVADLGRRLVVTMKPDAATWGDGSRPVGPADLVRSLADRADPSSPAYSARWADLVERIEPEGSDRVAIRLRRAALEPAWWLTGPIGPAHAGLDGRVIGPSGPLAVGDGPYRPGAAGEGLARYDAAAGEDTPKIARIREVRLTDGQAAVAALRRGDISLLEHVPADRVTELTGTPGIALGRHARPAMHWIAIDGRTPVLRNRALRRALSYAIDRRTILEEQVLKRSMAEGEQISNGPFARGSYADAPDVKPLEYDPLLARMLVALARKATGGAAIKLTFAYPATPEARAAAPVLADAWRAAGLEIEAVERPSNELEAELRAGGKFDLAYRTGPVAEPARDAGPTLCPGYDAPPAADGLGALASPRARQVLLELEQATEWPTARALVLQIDREARDELPILPLWELTDHYAWRDRLTGPADGADRLYEGVAGWTLAPWFARE